MADSPIPGFDATAVAEELIAAALDAVRNSALAALAERRPRLVRWMCRHHAPLAAETAGDALAWGASPAVGAELLLRWAVTQLRPDAQPWLEPVPPAAWLDEPAWRPMLAIACYARWLQVPAFAGRYRPRPGESAMEQLCGLWGVETSTVYRYLDRGRRRLAQIALEAQPPVPARLALRRFVSAACAPAGGWPDDATRWQWHGAQAERALVLGHALTALWHAGQAHQPDLASRVLAQQAAMLAGEAETDAIVERLELQEMAAPARFDLLSGRADLARTRNAPERELAALERALQLATQAGSVELQGRAYAALGRYHEPRDADRSLACYEDAARLLRQCLEEGGDRQRVAALHLQALTRMAWRYVLNSHPGARALLDEIDTRRATLAVGDDLIGTVEQCWGEYWRIAGDDAQALAAKHRALNAFQRAGNQRSVLVTYLNLITLHGQAKELDKAELYARRVMEAAEQAVVEPALLVSTATNLSFAYTLSQRYDAAITQARKALALSMASDLRQHANRARYNLASALFSRFLETGDAQFEREGDAQLQRLAQAPDSECPAFLREAAKGLKAEVLGAAPERASDQLLDAEAAAHTGEMFAVQRERARLTDPNADAATRIRAHIEIARAYAQMAATERDQAQALAQAHDLMAEFAEPLGRLTLGPAEAPGSARRLADAWARQVGDLLSAPQRLAIVTQLLQEGGVNKSGYAALCGVSPATASSHLRRLAELGLVTQTGRGPSTRYLLAQAA